MPAAGVRGRSAAARVLIPAMAHQGARLMAAALRAFGTPAEVMETWRGLPRGKEFTSGKECFPCQVTLGDVLEHLAREEARLGPAFDASRYLYFMPEAGGPCRFGMYARFQKLVLDRFPAYRGLRIVCLTTEDAYATSGMVPPGDAGDFRKLAYAAVVMGDVLDRLTWRARPYERTPGSVDRLATQVLGKLEEVVERSGRGLPFGRFRGLLGEAAGDFAALMAGVARRPRIGVVGEIYLRSHPASNGDLVRRIEECGGEAVAASVAEWVNYVSFNRAGEERRRARRALGRGDLRGAAAVLPRLLFLQAQRAWMAWQRDLLYSCVRRRLDIQPDHGPGRLEKRLRRNGLFRFELGTEAPLSIGGALELVHGGFDGIVNVYPFTCMPGTLTAGILGPALRREGVPYLDAPCDDAVQPNRGTALATFLHQAARYRDTRIRAGGA